MKRKKEEKEPESIGELPLYTASITEEPGSRSILIARERSSGNLAFISVLVDEWKMGLKDCFGSHDAPKNRVHDLMARLPYVDADLKECKKIIKRGMRIAEEVGTKTPREFHTFKGIIGELDDVEAEGSLYKCFECGEGNLSEEVVEFIKEVTNEDVRRGVCGTPEETKIYFVCDKCKKRGQTDERDGWLAGEGFETRENYMKDVKKSLRTMPAEEYRKILEKEGWDTWGPVACMECGNEKHIEVDYFAVDGDLEPATPEEETMLHAAVQELSGDPQVNEESMAHLFIGGYFIISIPTCGRCGSHAILSDF